MNFFIGILFKIINHNKKKKKEKKKILYPSNRIFDFLQSHHNNSHGFHASLIRQININDLI